MLDHLDEMEKLARELMDSTVCLPKEFPDGSGTTVTEIRVMLSAILDRIYQIRNDLENIRQKCK